ncbi:helix-turn-helix transcriptional regulator [Methyloligella sp. 2.7D]|uniref:helix-turn-helix transcriptional regulator n=1 Tax=unclassified Methyloligella TaxID=2625955 RepID=UPI00157D5FFC|nr:helix-turn-helix transcriptional regulator [Methyloligella sp. GL2]QKP78146.1 helix-turn-helix transcriptional regulator [Methyloligella sp. GL2]
MDECSSATSIRCGDLAAASTCVGSDFKVLSETGKPDAPVLEGNYQLLKLRSGLVLHATDATELQDLTTHVVHQPGLTISIFLLGRVRVRQGEEEHRLGTAESGAAHCYLLNRTRPDVFVRHSVRGMRVRKVNVTVSPDWIAAAIGDLPAQASLSHFIKNHQARTDWPASRRLVSLAEQVLQPDELDPALQPLYLESRAIEILFAALSSLGQDNAPAAERPLRASDRQRLQRALTLFEPKDGPSPSVDEVAREIGSSVSSLQRLFHAAYGTSIFEHVRAMRLKKARDALAADGVSVAEAARLAGYGNPANFATAFKRVYGVSPREARSKS